MTPEKSSPVPVARLEDVTLRYGKTVALNGITLEIPAAKMVGLIGPDAVGKSSLLSLLAGARAVQEGTVEALGGDMASSRHRESVCPHIAYMPQGLGKIFIQHCRSRRTCNSSAGCSDTMPPNAVVALMSCVAARASLRF